MNDGTLRRVIVASMAAHVALAACDFTKPVEPDPGRRIPRELCAQLDQVVADARKQIGIEFEGDEAIIEDAAWRALGGGQDQLARALAYRQACTAEVPPLEQNVTIRNEHGGVLTRRLVTIETRAPEEEERDGDAS